MQDACKLCCVITLHICCAGRISVELLLHEDAGRRVGCLLHRPPAGRGTSTRRPARGTWPAECASWRASRPRPRAPRRTARRPRPSSIPAAMATTTSLPWPMSSPCIPCPLSLKGEPYANAITAVSCYLLLALPVAAWLGQSTVHVLCRQDGCFSLFRRSSCKPYWLICPGLQWGSTHVAHTRRELMDAFCADVWPQEYSAAYCTQQCPRPPASWRCTPVATQGTADVETLQV